MYVTRAFRCGSRGGTSNARFADASQVQSVPTTPQTLLFPLTLPLTTFETPSSTASPIGCPRVAYPLRFLQRVGPPFLFVFSSALIWRRRVEVELKEGFEDV